MTRPFQFARMCPQWRSDHRRQRCDTTATPQGWWAHRHCPESSETFADASTHTHTPTPCSCSIQVWQVSSQHSHTHTHTPPYGSNRHLPAERAVRYSLTEQSTSGSHSFGCKNFQDFSSTFQDPRNIFQGPCCTPAMFKYNSSYTGSGAEPQLPWFFRIYR